MTLKQTAQQHIIYNTHTGADIETYIIMNTLLYYVVLACSARACLILRSSFWMVGSLLVYTPVCRRMSLSSIHLAMLVSVRLLGSWWDFGPVSMWLVF